MPDKAKIGIKTGTPKITMKRKCQRCGREYPVTHVDTYCKLCIDLFDLPELEEDDEYDFGY